MIYPGVLLALFAAVFGSTASPTFGELPSPLLPFAALVESALTDTTARVVFSTKIPHDHAGPVLHIVRVMSDGEFFDEGEDVEVVLEQVLLIITFVSLALIAGRRIVVQQLQMVADLEFGDEMGLLKVGSQVAILGNVC